MFRYSSLQNLLRCCNAQTDLNKIKLLMKEEIDNEFKKYDWTVDYEVRKVTEKTYEIVFPECVISYFIDSMYECIVCHIKHKQKIYYLEHALRFNKKKTGYLYHNQSEVGISQYIEQYTKTLNSKLLNFILTDFSWCDRANKSLGL